MSATRGTWSADDIDLLKKQYPEHGVKIPELRLKFTESAIRNKAFSLKVTRDSYSAPHNWTDEELALLRRDYPRKGSDIPELRRRHPMESINRRASQLGISYEGVALDTIVTFRNQRVPFRSVLAFYNLPSRALSQVCRSFDLQELTNRLTRMFRFEDGKYIGTTARYTLPLESYIEQDGLLWSPVIYVEYYKPTWTVKQFSYIKCRRGFTATQTRDHLEESTRHRFFTPEEDDIILNNSTLSAQELGQLLGRNPVSVLKRGEKLGIAISGISPVASVHKLANVNKQIRHASTAYEGTDGKQYCFIQCAVCGRTCLIKLEQTLAFEHNDVFCSEHEFPAGLKSSTRLRWDTDAPTVGRMIE